MTAKNKLDPKYSEDTRLALLEQSITHLTDTLKRFEKHFDGMNKRFDDIDKRFDEMDKRHMGMEDKFETKFEKLDGRLDSNFKWTVGLMYSSIAGILTLLGHQFHWF